MLHFWDWEKADLMFFYVFKLLWTIVEKFFTEYRFFFCYTRDSEEIVYINQNPGEY